MPRSEDKSSSRSPGNRLQGFEAKTTSHSVPRNCNKYVENMDSTLKQFMNNSFDINYLDCLNILY